MIHQPKLIVSITLELQEQIANQTLHFFECAMNEIDFNIAELYKNNNLNQDTLSNINTIKNTTYTVTHTILDETQQYIIHSPHITIIDHKHLNNLFVAYDDNTTEVVEYI